MKNVSTGKNDTNTCRTMRHHDNRTVKSHSPGFACQPTNICSGMCYRTKEDGIKHIVCFTHDHGWDYVDIKV